MQDTTPDSVENDAPAQPTSLGSRLMNVFISPSEVFDEVKTSEYQVSNWLAPLAIAVITSIIFTMVVFSQPAIMQRMREPAESKVQKMVDDGKVTRQQADQQLEMMEKFMTPTVFKFTGILGAVFFNGALMSLGAFAVWMLGTFLFKGVFTYGKAMEAVGLATIITVPGTLVSMCLAVIYENISMTPGPVLLVSAFDPHNRVHLLLSSLNLFMLWYLAVVAIGMSRLSGASFLKCALWGFGLWGVFFIVPAVLLGGMK